MNTQINTQININVLDSEFWKPGQCIMRISEQEFDSFFIDKRKRLVKRKPEFWIFVETQSAKIIPLGENRLFVGINSFGKESYSLAPWDTKSLEILNTDNSFRCEPHLFRISKELRIIFCEKCGKIKQI